jgi:hypothetical protein
MAGQLCTALDAALDRDDIQLADKSFAGVAELDALRGRL